MRDLIEKVMKQNGNEKLTLKELLWYQVAKSDEVAEKLNLFITTCSDKFTSKKTFWRIINGTFGLLLTLIGALAWVVFK